MEPNNVSLDDMKMFGAIAQTRSLTGASRLLGYSKQTVSRRLVELERTLGTQLVHRTSRSVQLTQNGAAYADQCQAIVRLADDVNQRFGRDQLAGQLRITADRVFGDAFLPELVAEFARRYPDVNVELLLSARKLDLVEDAIDIAFRVGSEPPPGLICTTLGPARLRYCASPDYLRLHGVPERPEDLKRHECIYSDESSKSWPFSYPNGKVVMVDVGGRLKLDSFSVVRTLVLAGLGIAVFPEFACRTLIASGQLRSILDKWGVEVGSVAMLHAHGRHLSDAARSFVELVKQTSVNKMLLAGRS